MKKLFALMAVSCLAAISGCIADTATPSDDDMEQMDSAGTVDKVVMPTADFAKPAGAAAPQGSGNITNHGGPVMSSPIKIYYIFYGSWSAANKQILLDFANSIGGSPYWNINMAYGASGMVTLGGTVGMSAYPNGKNLSDNAIATIVSNAINGLKLDAGNTKLPKDANGVYFVATAPDVKATSGFCTQYCGWHTYGNMGGTPVKYSFVGDPSTQCMNGCAPQNLGPNGTSGIDAMISILAHELEEAATDPQLNAWYDAAGWENADKCAWDFGTTSIAANGSKYNVTLGARKYLIQQNLKLGATQTCAMQ